MAIIIDPTRPNSSQEETKILTPNNIHSPEEFMAYMLHDVQQLNQAYEYNKVMTMRLIARMNQVAINQIAQEQRIGHIEKFLTDKLGYEAPTVEVPELPQQSKDVLEEEKLAESQAFSPHPMFGVPEDTDETS